MIERFSPRARLSRTRRERGLLCKRTEPKRLLSPLAQRRATPVPGLPSLLLPTANLLLPSAQLGNSETDELSNRFKRSSANPLSIRKKRRSLCRGSNAFQNRSWFEQKKVTNRKPPHLDRNANRHRKRTNQRPGVFRCSRGVGQECQMGGHGLPLHKKFSKVNVTNLQLWHFCPQAVQNAFFELSFAFGGKQRIGFGSRQNRQNYVADSSDGKGRFGFFLT